MARLCLSIAGGNFKGSNFTGWTGCRLQGGAGIDGRSGPANAADAQVAEPGVRGQAVRGTGGGSAKSVLAMKATKTAILGEVWRLAGQRM